MLPIKLLYKVRRFLFAALLARVPALSAFSRSVPVKTLAMLSCAGCISVVFATLPRMTPWTFGSCCGAFAALCLTLAARVHVDEEVVSTFSPIMSGTPRAKMRSLHQVLHGAGVALGYLGAVVVAARRYDDERRAAAGGGDAPAPLAASQVACAGALGLVSLQVARASPFDVDDPAHVALSHVALDAVALAEVAACLGFGAPSASTFLVAWTLGLLWLCNAAQIHELQAGGRSSSEDDDAPPAKSDGAISFSV